MNARVSVFEESAVIDRTYTSVWKVLLALEGPNDFLHCSKLAVDFLEKRDIDDVLRLDNPVQLRPQGLQQPGKQVQLPEERHPRKVLREWRPRSFGSSLRPIFSVSGMKPIYRKSTNGQIRIAGSRLEIAQLVIVRAEKSEMKQFLMSNVQCGLFQYRNLQSGHRSLLASTRSVRRRWDPTRPLCGPDSIRRKRRQRRQSRRRE